MAPNNNPEASQIDTDASFSLDDLDRLDPPPPNHKSNTPEEDALNDAQLDAWCERNMDYLQSFDSRGLHHLPLLSRLWGYDYNWYSSRIIFEVAELTSWTGRRLTPEEMSLVTSHVARGVVAASHDRPIAMGATTYALWRGWSSYRMPFYQPRFTRFMHPQATYRPYLLSLAWHSARVGIYGFLGLTAYELLAQRYRSHMMNAFVRDAVAYDPGLEDVEQDIDDNLARINRERELRHGKTE